MQENILILGIATGLVYGLLIIYKELKNEKGNIAKAYLLAIPLFFISYLCYSLYTFDSTMQKIDREQFQEYKKVLDFSKSQ